MISKVLAFVHEHWTTIVAVLTGVWTLIQEFRHQVLAKK